MSKKNGIQGKDLVVLAGLGIGAYLLYKWFSGGTSASGYSNGWIPGDTTPQTPMNDDENTNTSTPKGGTQAPNLTPILPPITIPGEATYKTVYYPVSPGATQPVITPVVQPTITATYTTPSSYVTTTNQPTTTVVKQTGTQTEVFQNVATVPINTGMRTAQSSGNYTAKITTGTPAQQIEQYSTGSKVIKVGGVVRKVM